MFWIGLVVGIVVGIIVGGAIIALLSSAKPFDYESKKDETE